MYGHFAWGLCCRAVRVGKGIAKTGLIEKPRVGGVHKVKKMGRLPEGGDHCGAGDSRSEVGKKM